MKGLTQDQAKNLTPTLYTLIALRQISDEGAARFIKQRNCKSLFQLLLCILRILRFVKSRSVASFTGRTSRHKTKRLAPLFV
jgi:hypothetical protein